MRRVEVMPYNKQWVSMYEEEASKLRRIFGATGHVDILNVVNAQCPLSLILIESHMTDVRSYKHSRHRYRGPYPYRVQVTFGVQSLRSSCSA